jgi:hypothetical protein
VRGDHVKADRRRRSDRPIPARPYRDTALVYGVLALLLVVAASLTGGDVVRAVVVAAAFFVVATAWSWWRFRERIRERDAAASAGPRDVQGDDAEVSGNGRGSTS